MKRKGLLPIIVMVSLLAGTVLLALLFTSSYTLIAVMGIGTLFTFLMPVLMRRLEPVIVNTGFTLICWGAALGQLMSLLTLLEHLSPRYALMPFTSRFAILEASIAMGVVGFVLNWIQRRRSAIEARRRADEARRRLEAEFGLHD